MTIFRNSDSIGPRSAVLAGAALFLLSMAAGTTVAKAEPSAFERACSIDMDFAPGSTDYRSCVEILTRAQTAQREQNALKSARSGRRPEERACAEIGLTPRDTAYPACVSMLQNAAYRPLLPSGE